MNFNISTDQFIDFIGVKIITENDDCAQNRGNLFYAINLILGLLRRIKYERKICLLQHIVPLVYATFNIIKNLNSLWRNEYQTNCHPDYRKFIFVNITETDKINLLESNINSEEPKSNLQRMQTYIWTLHENCYALIGASINLFKRDILNHIIDFTPILCDLEYMPLWKLKMIFKQFLKPIILNCQDDAILYERTLLTLLDIFLPTIFNKLDKKWEEIKNQQTKETENELNETDNQKTQNELVEDQLVRLISREYIDLMSLLIQQNKSNEKTSNNSQKKEEEDTITQLGKYLLQNRTNLIVMTIAKSVCWRDSSTSIKSSSLNLVLFEKLIQENLIKSVEGAMFLFEQILKGLSIFGEHEHNQSSLLQLMLILYDGSINKLGFNLITAKLAELCGPNLESWQKYEEKFISKSNVNEKRKKEELKKLLDHVIGVSFILICVLLYVINYCIDSTEKHWTTLQIRCR